MRDSSRINSLMYHDLVEDTNTSASGFEGAAADRYKQTPENFESHLAAIEQRCVRSAKAVDVATALSASPEATPWVATFDDGGVSAVDAAARLKQRGSVGHFFVTTSRIGTSGFLSEDQIRSLREAGHVIGSHSHTHPAPISALSDDELQFEWQQSVSILAELLGEPVTVASVPGGFYSRRVALAAEAAGIRRLFTSEPKSRVETVGECTILGRYTILRRSSARVAAAFAAGAPLTCLQQRVTWDAKKTVKWLLGARYIRSTRKVHESLKVGGDLAATLATRTR